MNSLPKLREAPAPEPRIPFNTDAEQAVLGAVMYENEALHRIDGLLAAHFYEPFHQRLWAWVLERAAKGLLAEPIIALEHFAADPGFIEFGGVQYLMELVERAPPAANARDYARHVIDLSQRRDLQDLAKEMTEAASDSDRPVLETAAEACRAIERIESGVDGEHWTGAGQVVRDAIEHAMTHSGDIDYPTGIPSLDEMLGGLHAGEVTILAARPGMGKSVGALTVARAAAEKGLGVCVFSLEMTKAALGLRLACDVAYERHAPVHNGEPTCPTFNAATKGDLSPDKWRRLHDANATIDRWPLMIDDRSGLTMAQIEAAARRQHRQWAREGIKPGPVIIDHLGKVRPSNDRKGAKHAEVADVSNDTQTMAKRLAVPVLALVQLSRGVEGRDDKRPVLSDLRQAGELEEDARQVIFLFRPEYYCREGKPGETFEQRTARLDELQDVRNQLFWLVEKNSHGPRGQVQSFCEIACSAFREW